MKHYWEIVSMALKIAIQRNKESGDRWLIAPCGDFPGVTIEAYLEARDKARGWYYYNDSINTNYDETGIGSKKTSPLEIYLVMMTYPIGQNIMGIQDNENE